MSSELEKQADAHECQLAEIDNQQKELLSNVRKETEELERQRKLLTSQLTKVLYNVYDKLHQFIYIFLTRYRKSKKCERWKNACQT